MPSDDLPPPPYRDPIRLPAEQRVGLTIDEPGRPFEHFCHHPDCGDPAPFGFQQPHHPEAPTRCSRRARWRR